MDARAQTVTVQGKPVRFEFNRRFGPLLVDKDGEPLSRQPMSKTHPFWVPFQAWLKEWLVTNPEPSPAPCPTAHLDRSAASKVVAFRRPQGGDSE